MSKMYASLINWNLIRGQELGSYEFTYIHLHLLQVDLALTRDQ